VIDEAARARWVRVRMGLLCGVLSLGLGLVVSAAHSIMVVDGPGWREIAEMQRERRLRVAPKRGALYDRNGDALAVSVEVPSASLDAVELLRGVAPQQIPFVARDAANRIGAVLSIDPAVVERRILAKRRFAWLKRQITVAEADGVRRLAAGDGEKTPLRGLVVEGEGRRYYPRRELAGPLLGFVAPDGEGKDGLEYALNEDLTGRVEQLRGLRDRSGRLLFSEGAEDERALAGHDVTLSIDQGLQYLAEHELAAAVRTFEAAGGSVVVVDPRGSARARELPAVQPERLRREQPGRAAFACHLRRVRTRLDLEDFHDRGRARGGFDQAHGQTVLRKGRDGRGQRRHPRHAPRRVAAGRAGAGGVLEYLLGQGRSRARG
jgi:cell division protein FtsI (penicillin-binding protein 3)